MQGWPDVAALVAEDLPREDALRDLIGDVHAIDEPSRVPRIRPVLVALAARAAGAHRVGAEAQHAAEVLHVALVVHDLTLGQRGGRRRRVARRVLRRIGAHGLTLRALELARHASSPMVLGEAVDALREISDAHELASDLGGRLATEAEWREHAGGHAGAVFSFCCRAGAHLGSADPATLAALGRYGRHVGRLWNVVEDVVALEGSGAGAHLVARAMAGRPVLPVVRAAARDPGIARAWSALADDPQPDVARDLAARVLAHGGMAASLEVMANESWTARRALGEVPPSPYRRGLDRLAQGLVRPEAA